MKGVDEKCYIGDVKNLHYDLHQDIRDLEELFLDDMVENLDEIARAYGVLSERYLPVDLGFIRWTKTIAACNWNLSSILW